MQVPDWVAEEAELRGFLPSPGPDLVSIGQHTALQGEDEREGVFGNGVIGVVPYVGDRDAALGTASRVDVVGACRRYRNHAEIGKLTEGFTGQRHLVDDRDRRATEALDDLCGLGAVVFLPHMRDVGPAEHDARADRPSVEEDDPVDRGIAH